jgi:hypothetical protein
VIRAIRAVLSFVPFVAATILGSVLAVACGPFDRTGDSVLA